MKPIKCFDAPVYPIDSSSRRQVDILSQDHPVEPLHPDRQNNPLGYCIIMHRSNSSSSTPAIELADAYLNYYQDFLTPNQADSYLQRLQHTLVWQQHSIWLFGRQVAIPRLQCWYGEPGLTYSYSGLLMTTRPWTPELDQLRRRIEQLHGYRFNAVLANLYRDGRDSVGWHADNEAELGDNPVIASLSLGSTRSFKLRRNDDHRQQHTIELEHGSVLLMSGSTQHHWQHCLPKRSRITEPRINLTFRLIH